MSLGNSWAGIRWLRAPGEVAGRVLALYAVNARCLHCVESALPQAQRVHELFPAADVAVVAVQIVDQGGAEWDVMAARYSFAMGVDSDGAMLKAYDWAATPSLTLIDRRGRVRRSSQGVLPDLQLGAELMSLAREAV